MSSTLSITSGAVFNKVLLFMLKEADGIFRRMLGLQQDSTTAAAGAAEGPAAAAAAGASKPSVLLAEQVTKAQRWRKVSGQDTARHGTALQGRMGWPDWDSLAGVSCVCWPCSCRRHSRACQQHCLCSPALLC